VAPANVNSGWVGVATVPSTSIAGTTDPAGSTLTANIAVNVDRAWGGAPPIDVDGTSSFPTQSR